MPNSPIPQLNVFNPHSPRGERLLKLSPSGMMQRFQSTLPARGATIGNWVKTPVETISIHTPREGSDVATPVFRAGGNHFNPHSPRGERQSRSSAAKEAMVFQSTLPARGATFSVMPDFAT